MLVGIAHNPELTGECDLNIYAFSKITEQYNRYETELYDAAT